MKNSTKIMKTIFLALIIFSFLKATAQPILSWTANYNGTLNGTDKIVKTLPSGNFGDVVVCGNSLGAGTLVDIVVRKYNKSGTLIWSTTFNDTTFYGNDIANNMLIDISGNIYIVGKSTRTAGYDAILLKYDSNGNFVFKKVIYGIGDDEFTSIATDPSGNIVCGGTAYAGAANGVDFLLNKYSNTGVPLWTSAFIYHSSASNNDILADIAVDPNNIIYATGETFYNNNKSQIYSIKLSSLGAIISSNYINFYYNPNVSFGGYATNRVSPKAIKIASNGDLYIAGISDTTTQPFSGTPNIKYNVALYHFPSSNFTSDWQRYIGVYSGTDDYFSGISVDGSNIYLSGYSNASTTPTSNYNMFAAKFNSSGVKIWQEVYTTGLNDDISTASTFDNGSFYLVGTQLNVNGNKDIVTLKYNSDGIQQWSLPYPSAINNYDEVPQNIFINNFQNLHIGGYGMTQSNNEDFLLIKYCNSNPTLNVISSPINFTVCAGSSLTLTASGAQTYSWTDNVINGTPFTPTSSGNYTVTGEDAGGCFSSNTVSITVNPQPVPSVISQGGATTFCVGNNVVLNGNVAGTWSNGFTTPTITVTTSGTYSVTNTNACGSTTSNSIVVTVTPLPVAPTISASGSTNICSGSSITLSGNAGGTWSNGSTNSTISVNQAGTYYVTNSNSCGIDTSNYITTTITPLPTPSTITAGGNTTFCVGNNVVLNGNIGGTWSNGFTTPTIIVTTSGTYSVTNTNTCGSTTSNTITVTVNPLPVAPTISASGSTNICSGNSITLSGNVGGTWSNGATNATINVNQAGIYYTTNSNSCGIDTSNYITTTITPQPTASIISASGVTTFCTGGNVILAGNVGGSWSNGLSTSSITVTTSGTYFVTNSNTCGNVNSDSIVVTVNPLPTPSTISIVGSVSPSICAGENITLSGNNSGVWNTNAITQTIQVSQQGDYYIINSNACGNSYSDTISVSINALPTPQIVDSMYYLRVDSIIYNQYQWLLDGNIIIGANSFSYTPLTNGIYSLIVTNASGCIDTSNAINLVSVNLNELRNTSMKIFPNPTSYLLNIKYTTSNNSNIKVQIINSLGQIVEEISQNQKSGTYNFTIDTQKFEKGIYFVRFYDGIDIKQEKIIIQ